MIILGLIQRGLDLVPLTLLLVTCGVMDPQ